MIQIEILLIIIANNHILMTKQGNEYALPREFLGMQITCLKTAAHLLKKYTNIQAIIDDVGWIPLVQKRIQDNRIEDNYRTISIPYLAFLPEKVAIPNSAEWVHIYNLSSLLIYKDHLQIITSIMSEGLNV
jgi:hypothetical protein